MYTHSNKKERSKNPSLDMQAINEKKRNNTLFQFVDNRPETFSQKRLIEMANNSPRVQQLKVFQRIADRGVFSDRFNQVKTTGSTIQEASPIQKKENNTGLPDNLKTGIENLSGHSMDDVNVHYNSEKPAKLQAHAYAQGTDIHIASGQEKHLPHEAWHVVQQKQGRVKPTIQMKGNVNINDDIDLEKEADVMGEKAVQMKEDKSVKLRGNEIKHKKSPIQRLPIATHQRDRQTLRDYGVNTGNLNEQQRREIDQQIGATNAVEIGLGHISLLIRNGLTVHQLSQIVGTLPTLENIATLITKAFPAVVKPYQNIASLPQICLDYVLHPPVAAPNANQLDIAYGNYLNGPHAPHAYAQNLHANFVGNYQAANPNYYDYTSGNFVPLTTLYDDYIERTNDNPPRTLQQFAGDLVSGQNYTLYSGAKTAVPGWVNNTGLATQRELTLLGGVPVVIRNYSDDIEHAIQTMGATPMLTRQILNHAPDGNAAMILLLGYLANNNNDGRTLNNIYVYQNNLNIDVLANANQLNPVYHHTWEHTFLHAILGIPDQVHRDALIAHLQANINNLLAFRTQMHTIDGTPAPNLGPSMGLLALVMNTNPAALPDLVAHMNDILAAAPHTGARNLPFGNRAGGLRGHFKKHVLKMNGNTDNVEPIHWLNDLNILNRFTCQDTVGHGLTYTEKNNLFGQPNPPGNTPVLGAAQLINFVNTSLNGNALAETLAGMYENDYHAYVQNIHDHATGKYIYYHGGNVKINSYAGNTFTVAAMAGGVFDFSSGYKPFESGGANVKWDNERGLRLWDL